MADVFDIPDLGLLGLSYDSKSILIFSNREDVTHIYQAPLPDPKQWKNLTPGKDRVMSGRLSNDDGMLVFPKDTQGDEKHNLYLTDMRTYETSLLLELDSLFC